jgi:hypothetical protein
MGILRASAIAVLHVTATLAAAVDGRQAGAECRCLPGDECWPSEDKWSALNSTVAGRLVATVPLASPCHDPNYDEAACTALQEQWTLPELQ